MEQVQTANNGTVPVFNAGKSASQSRLRRNLPSLPSNPGASEMGDVSYSCKVDASPTGWDALPLYSPFSLSADGSYPMVKVTRSKACELRTGKSILVGSGRCYRVIF